MPLDGREFALHVVQQLQAAGHQALWAGGCVRDQLLGLVPKDYDVATSARPDQVREVFGYKRTLAIGAAFGVISVLGGRGQAPIEVATFRKDGGYSDGRRPDTVEYTDAREDALRRDFTINGMFLDPIRDEVLDFVNGQQDLANGIIRAIGQPAQRIAEDKLRMLRGVRFAATFGFELEAETLAAIAHHAAQLQAVSAERVGGEMQRMLAHPGRVRAIEALVATGLLSSVFAPASALVPREDWHLRLMALERLALPSFEAAAALWLEPVLVDSGMAELTRQWRISNDQRKAIGWICQHRLALQEASRRPWSEVQPLLLSPWAPLGLAVAEADQPEAAGVALCRQRLAWPPEQLDPPPLLNGSDLLALGISPGPNFKSILNEVRNRQLDGLLQTAEQARQLAIELGRA